MLVTYTPNTVVVGVAVAVHGKALACEARAKRITAKYLTALLYGVAVRVAAIAVC